MAALINYITPTWCVELIRDAIAYAIALELPNQATLRQDSSLNATVYLERFISYDNTELPIVNVSYNKTPYVSKDLSVITGEHQFFIDVITMAEETDELVRGDKKAAILLHKIIGIIKHVLDSQEYMRLPPLPENMVANKYVQEIKIFNPDTPYNPNVSNDGLYVIGGRLIFNVRANDSNIDIDESIKVASIFTDMQIDVSGKGYKIEVLNNN